MKLGLRRRWRNPSFQAREKIGKQISPRVQSRVTPPPSLLLLRFSGTIFRGLFRSLRLLLLLPRGLARNGDLCQNVTDVVASVVVPFLESLGYGNSSRNPPPPPRRERDNFFAAHSTVRNSSSQLREGERSAENVPNQRKKSSLPLGTRKSY